MKPYGGIDLHSNNNVVALTEEADRVVYRKRLANDAQPVLGVLERYRTGIDGLVVEATTSLTQGARRARDRGWRQASRSASRSD